MIYILLTIFCFVHSSLAQSASQEAAGTQSGWAQKHQTLVTQTTSNKGSIKAVFVGDSITEGWGWSPDWGVEIWNSAYKPRGAFNYGIAGDSTSNVIYRINHNEFDGVTPKVVVVMIGTNNVPARQAAGDIANGIKAVVSGLKTKMGSAQYILMGVLPRNGASEDQIVQTINSQISGTGGVSFVDLGAHFRTGVGNLNASAYRDDKLHINANGYKIWHDGIESQFSAAVGA